MRSKKYVNLSNWGYMSFQFRKTTNRLCVHSRQAFCVDAYCVVQDFGINQILQRWSGPPLEKEPVDPLHIGAH